MRFILYAHSLVSDWNHGNAHFLRGILTELQARGHATLALEPAGGWSRSHLVHEQGRAAESRFSTDFPHLRAETYTERFDHEAAVQDADVVLVHEWTAPELVARLGALRRQGGRFTLLFHDTHHRAVSDEASIGGLDLAGYDAVLAFGNSLRERYVRRGWGDEVFTWHEAADTRLFRPREPEAAAAPARGELIWIGNWGDGEREHELIEFLVDPARALSLSGTVHGVRYPPDATGRLARTRLRYLGWIANADVPAAFARHRLTVHVPRRPYTESLPGIPTIRMFEALACGIPLVSAPWHDSETLFRPGVDFLFAHDGAQMRQQIDLVRRDSDFAASLARNGLATIRRRHTCAHRVDELFGILRKRGSYCVRQALMQGSEAAA